MTLNKFVIIKEMRDTSFNSFLAGRKETRSASKITFSIVKVTNKTNSHGAICSEIMAS